MTDQIADESGETGAVELPAPRRRLKAPAVLAAAIVIAGGGTAAGLELSSGGGTGSPTDAVAALLTAANKSDALGALDALDPGERDAIRPGLTAIVSDLQRLNVLGPGTNLSKISGLKFDFAGARTTTNFLTQDVALVTFKGGSATSSENPATLPLGSFVRSVAGPALSKAKPQTSTSSMSSGNEGVATVNVGGHWYVSLGYTIAIDSLRSSGKSATPPAQPITPSGASSSTGAVEKFVRAIAALDVPTLIADEAPDEMAALQSYAPLFLPKANAATAKARRVASVTITQLGLTSTAKSDGELVQLHSVSLTANLDGIAASLSVSGDCVTATFATEHIHQCASSASNVQKELGLLPVALRPIVTRLSQIRPQVGIMTVEEDGQWYVSPTRTLLDDVDAYLSQLEPSDLTRVSGNLPGIELAVKELEQRFAQRQLPTLS